MIRLWLLRCSAVRTVKVNPFEGHRHAFYLPLDEDGDGRLDHLLVFAAEPFDKSELKALDILTSVWQPDRRPDVRLVLVSLSSEIPALRSTRWVSATPFVISRHYRKGRGAFADWLNGEIRKECSFHGFPAELDVRWIPHTLHTGHPIRWTEFIRRKKGELPLHGYGCTLIFKEPVAGPMALGAGCHFGLGLFVPMSEEHLART